MGTDASLARPAKDPRVEEREARARTRALEKARREKSRMTDRETRSRRAQVIREELARRPECRCGIRPSMTSDDLVALGEGCTHGSAGYICPCLDAIRRRLGR